MINVHRLRMLVTFVAILGAIAFAVAEGKPVLILASLGAGIVSWIMVRGRQPMVMPRSVLNALVLFATGHVILGILGRRTEVISQLTEFIVWVLLAKLLDRKVMRDEAQVVSLSAFAVIGAVLTSNNLALGGTLLLYTPLVVLAMLMLQLGLGAEEAERMGLHAPLVNAPAEPAAGKAEPLVAVTAGALSLTKGRGAGLGVLAVWLLATLLSVLLAVGAFVATPRGLVRDSMGGWGGFASGARADFNDSITLGSSGLIQTSQQPVMEVRLLDADGKAMTQPQQTLYLRGAVLDIYDPDQRSWQARADRGFSRRVPYDSGQTQTLGDLSRGRLLLRQEITLRSTSDGPAPLFSVYRPVELRMDRRGTVEVNSRSGLLHRTAGGAGLLGYTTISAMDYLCSEEEAAVETEILAKDPPAFASGPIRTLAESILARTSVDLEPKNRVSGDNRRAVQAFLNYLRDGYTYSLEMTAPPQGTDPIQMFLFQTRQGHCEYFASALAAMCQSVHIPARVVTGYAGGEFNGVGGYYTIRRSDAHAWVELRLNPERWETFDPTPPGDLPHQQRSSAGVLGWLKQLYDTMEFSWVENVVTFDQTRATGRSDFSPGVLERLMRGRVGDLWARIRDSIPERGISRAVWIGVIVGILALLAIAANTGYRRLAEIVRSHLALRRSRAQRSASIVTGPDTRFYGELLDLLQVAGLGKPETVTPLAHAASLEVSQAAVGQTVRQLVERYYELRFGARGSPPGSAAAIAEEMGRLRSLLSTAHATAPKDSANP